jgi:hypothetical protein
VVFCAVLFVLACAIRSDWVLRRWRQCCGACLCTFLLISLLYSIWIFDASLETDENGAVWLALYWTPGPAGQLHYIGEAVSLVSHVCAAALIGFMCFSRQCRLIVIVLAMIIYYLLLMALPFVMSPPNPSNTRPKALEVVLESRMCNNMIQWLFARIDADRFGNFVRTRVRAWYQFSLSHGGALYGFPNIKEDSYGRLGNMGHFAWWMDRARGLGEAEEVSCPGDPYKQNYLFFQSHRPLARHLWDTGSQAPRIGDDDIAVHFRLLEVNDSLSPDQDTFVPPYRYYATTVNRSWRPGRKVWILVEPAQREHATVQRLQRAFGAQVHGGTAREDWVAGTRARVFIGSQGTFSWTIAYASERASLIHLPFVSYLAQGATWLPWSFFLLILSLCRPLFACLSVLSLFPSRPQSPKKTQFQHGMLNKSLRVHPHSTGATSSSTMTIASIILT